MLELFPLTWRFLSIAACGVYTLYVLARMGIVLRNRHEDGVGED